MRLTTAHALVRYLVAQRTVVDGVEAPLFPGVFGIFAGFADDAKVENGWLKLPDRPGIGFEAQNQLYAVMKAMTA